MINEKLPHIECNSFKNQQTENETIVHNVGGGQVLRDCLFSYDCRVF
jgi:uncharacterized protein YijF (DUF1287 family)